MTSSTRQDIHGHIIDAAAEWFIEFNTETSDADTRRDFDAWLRTSPEHVRAYLEMFPLWDTAPCIDRERHVSTSELIELVRADTQNLIPLPISSIPARPVKALEAQDAAAKVVGEKHLSIKVKGLALAASVLLVALGALLYVERDVYSTGIGEQRVIALEEGSSIELNARSRLKLRFTATERRVELLEGQALFRVTKDSRRPFIVSSSDTHVRVLGTQFDVYKKPTGTLVTVLQGRVAVSRASDPGPDSTPTPSSAIPPIGEPGKSSLQDHALLLDAGEQALVTPAAIERPARTDPGAATAWLQHRLIFSATPLQEVVEEFNRYNERQIIVQNDAHIPFEVSGAFSMTDLPSLLRFLRAQPNVTIEERRKDIIVTLK